MPVGTKLKQTSQERVLETKFSVVKIWRCQILLPYLATFLKYTLSRLNRLKHSTEPSTSAASGEKKGAIKVRG